MPPTAQESLVEAITQSTFGAPFVFFPDHWQRGSVKKEPIDLVWYANECLVAFAMQERTAASIAKMSEHNVRQLRGMLMLWMGGRALKGRNEYQEFDISYEDVRHVIPLSVVGGQHSGGCRHTAMEKDLRVRHSKVALVASFPHAGLVEIAHLAGNLRDLIAILSRLPHENSPLDEASSIHLVRNAHRRATIGADIRVRNGPTDPELAASLAAGMLALKAPAPDNPNERPIDPHVDEVFNDMRWLDHIVLLRFLYKLAEPIFRVTPGEEGPIAAEFILERQPYRFYIGVVNNMITKSQESFAIIDRQRKLAERSKSEYPQIDILQFVFPAPHYVIRTQQRVGPSATTLDLDRLVSGRD